jgi:MarR family transcriptional regulator for hemolysin
MEPSFDRNIGWLVHDVARLLRKRFEQKARASSLGLTRAQAAVIAHLARQEGSNQASLAQVLEIEPITLVRLLDRLEELGLVERRQDPNDRRARLLRLTPQAHAMLVRIRTLGSDVREDACAGVSAERRDAMVDTLIAMKANLVAETIGDGSDAAPTRRLAHG